MYQVEKLSDVEASTLVRRILEKNPKPVQQGGALGALQYDSTLDKRYASYEQKTVPQFVGGYAHYLEVMYGQVPFKLNVANTGNIRADRVIVEVVVVGGQFNPKPMVVTTSGPPPPRAKDRFALPQPIFSMRDLLRPPVDKHEFQLDFESRSEKFSATCEDFRHGQRFELDGVLWLDPHAEGDATVVVKITVANLRGTKIDKFLLPKIVRRRPARELVDFDKLTYAEDPRLWPIIEEAFESEDFDAIEWYPSLKSN